MIGLQTRSAILKALETRVAERGLEWKIIDFNNVISIEAGQFGSCDFTFISKLLDEFRTDLAWISAPKNAATLIILIFPTSTL